MDSKNETFFEKTTFEQSPYINTNNQLESSESTESIDIEFPYIRFVITSISLAIIIIIAIFIITYVFDNKRSSFSNKSFI